jgi:hypothetical protein
MGSVSDIQKYRFRSAHQHDGAVCDVGFFAWTRHPNYFGEMIIQFGMFTFAVSPAAYNYVSGGAYAALYASIPGSFFLTLLLMFVSGLTLQERPGANLGRKRYEKGNDWPARWLDSTSILIPFLPQPYEKMPVSLKRTIFLEFPIHVFDPAKHADQSKVQDRNAEEGHAGRPSDEERLRQS